VNPYPHVNGPDANSDPTLAALLQQLNDKHRGAVRATLVYGSCLRSGDIYDGLLDLYLICDSYRAAYRSRPLAIANWVLPPNVFYAEQKSAGDGPTLRSKVTVISLRDFQRGCSSAWFESYIWGRFAQPTHILYARDETARHQVTMALVEAAGTLLRNAVPALPQQGDLTSLWELSLGLSYATELRTERSGRAGELAAAAGDFYTALTRYHAPRLGFPLSLQERDGTVYYHSQPAGLRRQQATLCWAIRRVQGKAMSIMRLLKGLFTFDGGLDYVAWKLERHSGVEIVIPDKVRQAPLIHLWGFFWGLYKRGIFK
jgi:hypothetical protein